jgi:hypothetical protein
VLFVHVPKTAGTSFRLGVQERLGAGVIVYDYGPDSPETSALAREFLYGGSEDFWGFFRACSAAEVAMVGGHVGLGRFVSGIGVSRTVCFLRDPLQRLVSEYRHFVRHHGFRGSFRQFYRRPAMRNRQTRVLGAAPPEAVGVLGITECYGDSVALVNARFGWNVPVREDNVAREALAEPHAIAPEARAELEELNAADLVLYQRARALLDARIRLLRGGQMFAHAAVQEAKAERVTGFAWWEDERDDSVEVELLVNGVPVGRTAAREFRPALCRLRPPRGGYVGFSFEAALVPGDEVQCRIPGTGQRFPLEPLAVSPSASR